MKYAQCDKTQVHSTSDRTYWPGTATTYSLLDDAYPLPYHWGKHFIGLFLYRFLRHKTNFDLLICKNMRTLTLQLKTFFWAKTLYLGGSTALETPYTGIFTGPLPSPHCVLPFFKCYCCLWFIVYNSHMFWENHMYMTRSVFNPPLDWPRLTDSECRWVGIEFQKTRTATWKLGRLSREPVWEKACYDIQQNGDVTQPATLELECR